jgi:perosamine synthetase
LAVIPLTRPWLGPEEIEAVSDVIRSGWVAQGPRVDQFENAMARYVASEHGIAVSSCTTGLHLALHALGVGPGHEVIVPSLSFIATANVARHVGAEAVFADVDPLTLNMTPQTIREVMTAATRAVVLVHQLGTPAQIDEIADLCREAGVELIEDAACAIGSRYRGELIGRHSYAVVFSFHPRKLLTTGEGGMIMTSDPEFADRLRRLRQHAMSVAAHHRDDRAAPVSFDELGFNFRMTDLQAAVGLVQLERVAAIIERRREQAGLYSKLLGELDWLQLPADPPYGETNYQSYAVVLEDGARVGRDALMRALGEAGIASRIGVMAAHREAAFSGFSHAPLPVTERITDRSLLLPIFHEMTEDDFIRVASVIADAGR